VRNDTSYKGRRIVRFRLFVPAATGLLPSSLRVVAVLTGFSPSNRVQRVCLLPSNLSNCSVEKVRIINFRMSACTTEISSTGSGTRTIVRVINDSTGS
jgi:hypothetical protein